MIDPTFLPLAALPETAGPYVGLIATGFLIGIVGHVAKIPWMIVVSLVLVLLTTVLLFASSQSLESRPLPIIG